jgi:hypothetical protein
MPEDFTVDIPSTAPIITGSVDLKGEAKDGRLVFTFENTTGRTIANCNFQFVLPEGMSIKHDPINDKYVYEEGDATKGMTFYTAFSNNIYTVIVFSGTFNETTGNTIITLPMEGRSGGEAMVSGVSFTDSDGNIISRTEDFTVEIPSSTPIGSVSLMGEAKNGSLVFTFENNSNKTIANCTFQLALPEGVSIKKNSTGKKYLYEEGDATEDMTFSIAFKNDKYTVTVYDGEFDESAGNTIITLPLEGTLGGEAIVSNIAFGDPDGYNINRPKDFSIDIPIIITGNVDLMGEVKDGSLVFTFENTTGRSINNCNFQLELPEGMSVKLNSTGKKYSYERGDATEDLAFSIAFKNNKYTVAISGGEFDESAGNTIVTLPLQGKSGGEATVSNILFGGPDADDLSRPEDFTIDIPSTAPTGTVDLMGEVKDGNLIFKFENTTGNAIANCNFQLILPEGVSLKPKGKKFDYVEGDATEGMTFYIAANNNQYTIAIFGDKFNETGSNTVITLPLVGRSGGEASVSNIAFGDSNGNNISRPEGFTIDVPSPNTGSVDLMGEVKDGSLVFTFENTSGASIANCSFQFVLPEGVSIKVNPRVDKCIYTEGDATGGMSFYVTSNNNKYTVAVFGGEFDETAGNTIISLPLVGTMSGEAIVSNISFGDPYGNNISRPEGFTMTIIGVNLNATIVDDNLVFTYENNSGMAIANCNFQFELPEGMNLTPNDEEPNATRQYGKKVRYKDSTPGINGESYKYIEGDATAGMNFNISLSNNVYNITINEGMFDETAGNTIVTLPLQGKSGGEATISDIAFEDPDNNPISESEGFTVNVDGVELKGEMADGYLVFTFDNNCDKKITNCNFQLALPERITISSEGDTFNYEEGDATAGMKFNISASNNVYTITVYDGTFNEAAGNTIIRLPLKGAETGEATVSNILFVGDDGSSISSPEDFNLTVEGTEDDPAGIKGDVNSDGEVDVMDVVAIYNIMLGKVEKTAAADVNEDGEVDVMDVVAVYNIMLGR